MPLLRYFTVSFLVATTAFAAEPPHAALDERYRTFFSDNCLKCHNAEKQKGKVRLDDISFTVDSIERADLWQKVIDAVNSGDMPPEDEKQPEPAAKTDFLSDLSLTMVAARSRLADSGGKSAMRRLNRREYKNTIRDLLGVEVDTSNLPADSGSGSFDTVGASLFMSSDQFEQYLALGRRALDDHFAAQPTGTKKSSIHRLEPETLANQALEQWVKNAEETEVKFKPWAAEVDRAAAAPENAEAMLEIRKREGIADPNGSLGYQLYYHAHLLKGAPRSEDHGLGDSFNAAISNVHRIYYTPFHKHGLALPHRQTGAYLSVGTGYQAIRFQPPHPAQLGKYILRMRVGAVKGSAENRRFIDIGPTDQQDEAKSEIAKAWSTHQVTGTIENPQIIEVPINITSQADLDFQIKERQPRGAGERNRFFFQQKDFVNGYGPEPVNWVDWVELEGPEPTATLAIPRIEPEIEANTQLDRWNKDSADTEAKFRPWAAEVERVAVLPENAQAMAEIIARDPHVKMPPAVNNFMLYYHADQLKGAPRPQDHGLGDSHNAAFNNQLRLDFNPLMKHFTSLPHRQQGAYLMVCGVYTRIDIKPPNPLPHGNYKLRVRLAATQESDPARRFIEVGAPDPADGLDWDLSEVWSTNQVTGTIENPQILELPIEFKSGEPQTISIRERQPRGADVRHNYFYVSKSKNGYGPEPVIWVDWVELENSNPPTPGKNPEVAQLNNFKNLDEHSHAKECLQTLAGRAFRGKAPGQEFLDKLFAIYDSRRKTGEAHDIALKEALSIILASPGFLYLQEIGSPSPPESTGRKALSPPELASRLSYFLWSAPPDSALLHADLTQPDMLAREVDRMLASEKSNEFIDGFVHQWLGMARLDFFQFNNAHFRDFDESTKSAARREVYETFAHLLRHNGSLSKLLKSDEVHVNGLLATYYGIEGVTGDAFQKVKLPANSPRGGLLGMAAILAMGSNGERTSPVERGAWVLRHLLHNPPPPAPPNVPQLDRLGDKPLSPRQRVAAHMEEPQCASCHRKIDPIGFGLENFDAVGKWREVDLDRRTNHNWPIDPAGNFHHGPAFKNYFELRDLIAAKSENFAQGFTEGLIEYALGRPYGFTDVDLAANMIAKAKADDFSMREFIQALVLSREFGLK